MTSTGRHLDETQAGIPNAPNERADLYGRSHCERHQGQLPKGRTQRPDIWAHRSRMGSAEEKSALDRGVARDLLKRLVQGDRLFLERELAPGWSRLLGRCGGSSWPWRQAGTRVLEIPRGLPGRAGRPARQGIRIAHLERCVAIGLDRASACHHALGKRLRRGLIGRGRTIINTGIGRDSRRRSRGAGAPPLPLR